MKASDYAITNYDDIHVGDRVVIAQYSPDLGMYENLQEASVTAKGDGHFKVLIIETEEPVVFDADFHESVTIFQTTDEVRQWVEYRRNMDAVQELCQKIREDAIELCDIEESHQRREISMRLERWARELREMELANEDYALGEMV